MSTKSNYAKTTGKERKKRDADLVLRAEYGMITDNPLKKRIFDGA